MIAGFYYSCDSHQRKEKIIELTDAVIEQSIDDEEAEEGEEEEDIIFFPAGRTTFFSYRKGIDFFYRLNYTTLQAKLYITLAQDPYMAQLDIDLCTRRSRKFSRIDKIKILPFHHW